MDRVSAIKIYYYYYNLCMTLELKNASISVETKTFMYRSTLSYNCTSTKVHK